MIKNTKMFRHIDGEVYIENFGVSYMDIEPGVTIKHWPGRTITEMDNTLMSMLSMNNHPIHSDVEFSKKGEFGKIVVSSLVTVSIVGGMSLKSTSAKGLMNLGWRDIKLTKPVFVGDTLYAESTYISKRESKSKERHGIVTVITKARIQNDEVVLEWERSFLMRIDE